MKILCIRIGTAFALAIGVAVASGLAAGDDKAPSPTPPSPNAPPMRQPPGPGAPTAPPDRGPAPSEPTQTIKGVVQTVEGSTMSVKSTAGETITVDLSPLGQAVSQIVAPGDTVFVTGEMDSAGNRMTARGVMASGWDRTNSPAALPRDLQPGRR